MLNKNKNSNNYIVDNNLDMENNNIEIKDKNKFEFFNEKENFDIENNFKNKHKFETDNNEKKYNNDEKSITISKTKIVLLKKILQNMKENFESINNLLSVILVNNEDQISIRQLADEKFIDNNLGIDKEENKKNRIIEGVFNGESMIGPDGKKYSVPENYASKSKLIEGDIMKLTITERGTFIYKQIGPIERSRVIAKLNKDSNGNYYATINDKKWYLLSASVTYYKAQEGDEIVLLVPKKGKSKWAAVENIVKKEILENYN